MAGAMTEGRHFVRADESAPRSRKRRRLGVALAVVALTSTLVGGIGSAATTVSPSEQDGATTVVREEHVTLDVGTQANMFARSTTGFTTASGGTANAAYSQMNPSNNSILNFLPCTGTNSPWSEVTVLDPNGDPVFHAESPEVGGVFSLGLQKWRGSPWSTEMDLTGAEAGVYTVQTRIHNKVRSTHNFSTSNVFYLPCTTGTPTQMTAFALGNPPNFRYTAGPVLETTTFEYRPWQQRFEDVFGGGSVSFNLTPEEFTFEVDGNQGPLVKGADGAAAIQTFGLPSGALFTPPADPQDCATDPASCLPSVAMPCNIANCDPRIVFIAWASGNGGEPGDNLFGFFDLDTRAFVAYARTNGVQRVLLSGGTVIDGLLGTTYAGLVQAAAAAGIDLPALLAQPVTIRFANMEITHEITVSLLEGLQIVTRPTDIRPPGATELAAGLIIHIGTWLGVPDLGGYSGYGYTVQEAGVLPAIPSGLPAPANLLLTGGKLRHVVGLMPEDGGLHIVPIGVSTQPSTGLLLPLPADIPLSLAGFPATVAPITGLPAATDSGVEFLGDDMVIAQFELCLGPLVGCFGGGTLIGTGLALFPSSPLHRHISIGELPALWTNCDLDMTGGAPVCPEGPVRVVTQLDGVIQDATTSILGNAAVLDAWPPWSRSPGRCSLRCWAGWIFPLRNADRAQRVRQNQQVSAARGSLGARAFEEREQPARLGAGHDRDHLPAVDTQLIEQRSPRSGFDDSRCAVHQLGHPVDGVALIDADAHLEVVPALDVLVGRHDLVTRSQRRGRAGRRTGASIGRRAVTALSSHSQPRAKTMRSNGVPTAHTSDITGDEVPAGGGV